MTLLACLLGVSEHIISPLECILVLETQCMNPSGMHPSVPWSCVHSKAAMPTHNCNEYAQSFLLKGMERDSNISLFFTYMSQKIVVVIWMTKPPVLFATHCLQQKHTKTEDVGFYWEFAINCILWRHIATAQKYQIWVVGNDEDMFWHMNMYRTYYEYV